MSPPYLPIPDLIRCLDDRDTFPAGVSDEELFELAAAADRLAARIRQETINRWFKSRHVQFRLAEGPGHD